MKVGEAGADCFLDKLFMTVYDSGRLQPRKASYPHPALAHELERAR